MKKALLILLTLVIGCNNTNSSEIVNDYETVNGNGKVNNILIHNNYVYGSMEEDGFISISLKDKSFKTIKPSSPADSINDLTISDNFLFGLDAKSKGNISVYSLEKTKKPEPINSPLSVNLTTFSGVVASSGNLIVSGGTRSL